jgi:hypothetical protein
MLSYINFGVFFLFVVLVCISMNYVGPVCERETLTFYYSAMLGFGFLYSVELSCGTKDANFSRL